MPLSRLFRSLILCVPLVAGGLVFSWNTRAGLAVYSDSVTYMWGAHSLRSGHGFSIPNADGHDTPVTFFPPLYSYLLAVTGAGNNVLAHARRLQLVLEILAVAITIAFVGTATDGSVPAMMTAGLLWAVAVDFTVYQSGVLSEGLFVMCAALACWMMLLYIQQHKRIYLLMAATATSAAWMTRYAGISWMAGGAAVVWFLSETDRRRQWTDTGLFVGIASFANALWMHRNGQLGRSILGRPFHLTRFWGPNQLKSVAMTFRWWTWQPNKTHPFVYAVIYGTAFTVFLVIVRRKETYPTVFQSQNKSASRLLLIYGAAYLGLTVVSAVCFQGDIFADSTRILIPLHWLVLLFIVLQLDTFLRPYRRRALGPWATALCGIVVALGLQSLPSILRKPPNLMYALSTYRDSSTIAALRHEPPERIIYSNLLFPVELYVGHLCREIPHPIDNATQRPNPRFDAEMTAMKEAVEHQGAILAYFKNGDSWLVWPSLAEIQTVICFDAQDRYSDGTLFGTHVIRVSSKRPLSPWIPGRNPLVTGRPAVPYAAAQ